MKVTRSIWIRTQFIGFHRWPEAPDELAYLRNTHRHLFKLNVTVPVERSNREIEFHKLQDLVNTLLKNRVGRTDSIFSCEDMAEILGKQLLLNLPNTLSVSISFSEDGECGALVTVRRD